MLIKVSRGWENSERDATPEDIYMNRRQLLKAPVFVRAAGVLNAGTDAGPYPAKRNPEFTLDRPITPEWAAEGYNNYYEFNQEDKKRSSKW